MLSKPLLLLLLFLASSHEISMRFDIFPGTKWCGVGNQSKSFNDLGFFQSTDKCCREHDNCEESIEVGMSKYGLLNNGGFAWSRCDCDKNLLKCLKAAKTPLAKYIGYIFFTILGPKCFQLSFPVAKCVEYHYYEHMITGAERRCIKYEYKTKDKKIYQLFDNPVF